MNSKNRLKKLEEACKKEDPELLTVTLNKSILGRVDGIITVISTTHETHIVDRRLE